MQESGWRAAWNMVGTSYALRRAQPTPESGGRAARNMVGTSYVQRRAQSTLGNIKLPAGSMGGLRSVLRHAPKTLGNCPRRHLALSMEGHQSVPNHASMQGSRELTANSMEAKGFVSAARQPLSKHGEASARPVSLLQIDMHVSARLEWLAPWRSGPRKASHPSLLSGTSKILEPTRRSAGGTA